MKDHPAIDFIPMDVEGEEVRFPETLDSSDIENEIECSGERCFTPPDDDWEMDLEDSKNHYICRCCSCLEKRKMYQQTLDETRSEKSTPYKGSRNKFSN